ncbi:MAG: hypothetical protein P3A28_09020 [Gemmatimonadota bacterium]|nr:hypothetical protein [Gemmatimonadota bacterium]
MVLFIELLQRVQTLQAALGHGYSVRLSPGAIFGGYGSGFPAAQFTQGRSML